MKMYVIVTDSSVYKTDHHHQLGPTYSYLFTYLLNYLLNYLLT